MKLVKVVFLEIRPVYVVFNEKFEAVGDGICEAFKVYTGESVNINSIVGDIEMKLSDQAQEIENAESIKAS